MVSIFPAIYLLKCDYILHFKNILVYDLNYIIYFKWNTDLSVSKHELLLSSWISISLCPSELK